MGQRKRHDFQLEGFSNEISQAVNELGELRELALENYISTLIRRTDAIKLANEILTFLEEMNIQSTKITDKDKKKHASKIDELKNSLKRKDLTPMEKRFLYEEISEIIQDMESIRRFWLQKSITGVKYVGAAGAVVAAALLFRKRK
ncbi:hypothetical protein [Ornithinibacillus sp. 179-J 7C1 HS]|uniref:hypothetical protein n=1 Tax=Ornithinibacillus sp. 179-J 7C1 HS TaxID=3142384 RepID=UPI0039A031E0